MLRTTLEALGHPQPEATPIQTDNACAAGIANYTIKEKRSKAIDMRFHWLRDRVRQKQIKVLHVPGTKQLADFFTKPLPVKDHLTMMTKFVRTPQRAHFNTRH